MSRWWTRVTTGLLVAGLLVTILSCGNVRQAAQKQQRMNTMKLLGIMYHNYNDFYSKGPSGPQDFQKMPDSDPAVVAALQSGQLIVVWDVKISELSRTQPLSNFVLGWEATTPTSGGIVLFADGAVQEMTPQQFQSATKAQPTGAQK